MAVSIPANLKAADLTRFIIRAAQLETAEPVMAYWCKYWIVNHILSKGLHNGDPDTLHYTTELVEKLEQIKAENASNDAIIDDTAGQAYVEQFALDTFLRADRAMNANKATKQTANTFQAAATFLELVNIWGPIDTDMLAKIKYAKWNAVRIIRAINEGKDPNETNPSPGIDTKEQMPVLDPNDPEVLQFGGTSTKPQPASVEDDIEDPRNKFGDPLQQADQTLVVAPESGHMSPLGAHQIEPSPQNDFASDAAPDDKPFPLEQAPIERNGSTGGYFPVVPILTSETKDSALPPAPAATVLELGLPQQPLALPGLQSTGTGFASFSPASLPDGPPAPQDFYHQPPPQPPVPPPQTSFQPTYHSSAPTQIPLVTSSAQATITKDQLNTDDAVIAKAQKHARWAISALNFEDANTAVRELREALKTLGAQ